MDLSYTKKEIAIFSLLFILPVIGALSIYINYRSEHVVINQLINGLFDLKESKVGSNGWTVGASSLPEWYIYNLPGALWLLSFSAVLSMFKINKAQFSVFHGAALLILILIELVQKAKISDGVYDPMDIYFYGLSFVIGNIVYLLLNKKKATKRVRNSRLTAALALFMGLIFFSDVWV